jgi:pimeloyl-ACP methyl ester carboxylesterase
VKVYLIPGIGADYRIFKHIRLPQGYEPRYIHWITPHKKENLGDYAFRLTQQMDLSEPFMVAGVSLGGIMAVEIAKRIPPVSTILISSIPLSSELPRIYRWTGPLHLDRIIPVKLLKLGAVIAHTLTIRQAANRRLMRQIDWSGNEVFTRWALHAVLDWRNNILPQPLFHLHGTYDVVFPIRFTRPTHIVPGVGHFFLLTRPEAVNQFLGEVLPAIPAPTSA